MPRASEIWPVGATAKAHRSSSFSAWQAVKEEATLQEAACMSSTEQCEEVPDPMMGKLAVSSTNTTNTDVDDDSSTGEDSSNNLQAESEDLSSDDATANGESEGSVQGVDAEKVETFRVKFKRVAVRREPTRNSEALLVLHCGERVTGTRCEVGSVPWLRVSKTVLQAHPHCPSLDQDHVWVLIDATATELELDELLIRAPAEMGWCASVPGEKELTEVYEVRFEGAQASILKDPASRPCRQLLEEGSLIKALQVDRATDRMRFELMTGSGPMTGWVDRSRLARVSGQSHTAPPARSRGQEELQDEAQVAAALDTYLLGLQKYKASGHCPLSRTAFPWKPESKEGNVPIILGDEVLEEAMASVGNRERRKAEKQDAGSPGFHSCARMCVRCRLPLGDTCYFHGKGKVHANCLAEAQLEELKAEEDKRVKEDLLIKKMRREEYLIGWSLSKMPRNGPALQKITGQSPRHGMVALALTKDNTVTLVPTACPCAAVSLEYLSVALKVRLEQGTEPMFSLDCVDPKNKNTMQVKRFEPPWLKNTLAGDVLFESDYHLKELSMGEMDQPVVGMLNCSEHSEVDKFDAEWSGREWFIVRKAEVRMSEDGVLIPMCKMGVEAREQSINENTGKLEDKAITRKDHPLVKYAEEFTKNFDLIAERKSVVYHLRELAKASILAKYLLQSQAELESFWWELFEETEDDCVLEIPQIRNERNRAWISIRDGRIVDNGEFDKQYALYGGVQFGMDRFPMRTGGAAGALQARRSFIPPKRMGLQARMGGFTIPRAGVGAFRGLSVPGALVPRRGFVAPSAALSARTGLFVRPSQLALPSAIPSLRGVDLNLDQFSLADTTLSAMTGPAALSEDIKDVTIIGEAFWPQLEEDHNQAFKSKLTEEDRSLFRDIFHPRLSDRRMEGDLFVPPDSNDAYISAVKGLLQKETEVRRKRKEHFLSKDFVVGNAGSLFPCSFNQQFAIKHDFSSKSRQKAELVPYDFAAKTEQIAQNLPSCSPTFDEVVEDGTRFRIYWLGSLEVRTTQEHDSREEIGAVFSSGRPSREEEVAQESEIVDRVCMYVEGSSEEPQFYVVIGTAQGNTIVTENLGDGTLSWTENPQGLERRIAKSKAMRSDTGLAAQQQAETCRIAAPATVQSLRFFQASQSAHVRRENFKSAGQLYAERIYNRAAWRQTSFTSTSTESFEAFAEKHYPWLRDLLSKNKESLPTAEGSSESVVA